MTALLSEADRSALHRRLLAIYRPYFGRVAANEAHLEQMAHDNLDERRSIEQLEALALATGRPLVGANLLEVGSGVGLTVAVARRLFGANAFGVEPGDDEYEGTLAASRDVLSAAGVAPEAISNGVGEALPFPDAHFDIVFSSNVLEHVDNPVKVLAEIVRVLKPGGSAQIVVPNYGSWWEGHYGVLWLPHLPATLGKLYVRLLGRDPAFIDTLRLVTRGKLENWIAPHAGRIEILDWGVGLWESRVRSLAFSEYSALGRLKTVLRLLHAIRVIPILIALGKAAHWETPIVLTFRKSVGAET